MDVSCRLLSLLTLIVAVQCRALALPVTNHEESHSQYRRTSAPPSSLSSSSSSSVPAVSSAGSSSQLCQFSQQSCYFYSHCIEENFHCGPTGFIQAYAKSRCERIEQLRNLDDESCENCIGNRAIYEWAVQQDSCLKQKLQSLVERDYTTQHSDPPTCLKLEKHGLELMEECSLEQSPDFCSALTASNTDAIMRDIEKIARQFRINSYYATQVERMLRNKILNCGQESQVKSIADSVIVDGYHSQRLVFCTVIVSYLTEIINSTYAMRMVAQNLNRPLEQFRFSGYDESRRCVSNYRYPEEITPAANDKLLFVTWIPEPDDELVETIGGEGHGYEEEVVTEDESQYISIFFYQYTPLKSPENFPECGDGMRQAGELCDMGVSNTGPNENNAMGCSVSCVPVHERVECSTGQFATSECWPVVCGDGVRSASEECDIGAHTPGSGCSATCKRDPDYTCSDTYNSTSICTHMSATTETTPTYPPATTSPPSKLPTSTSSSLSHLSLSSTSSSAGGPPPSSSSPISPHLTNPPTVAQLSSSSQTSTHLSWRNVALQCLVSILISWTAVLLLMAR